MYTTNGQSCVTRPTIIRCLRQTTPRRVETWEMCQTRSTEDVLDSMTSSTSRCRRQETTHTEVYEICRSRLTRPTLRCHRQTTTLITLDTSRMEISPLKDDTHGNMGDMPVAFDTSHLRYVAVCNGTYRSRLTRPTSRCRR